MELNSMIKELIDSGIIENQELAVTLLGSDQVDDEIKRKHIDSFIKDYTEGKVNFFDEEHKHIFKAWVGIYQKNLPNEVKNRVTKIEFYGYRK